VLSEAFPPVTGWDEPAVLRDALWSDPGARAIYEAVRSVVEALPDVVGGQRKAYSAWSREFQFAAARPVRDGSVMLGLAVPLEADARLQPVKNEPWSERLKSRLALASPAEMDASVATLLKQARDAG
jgi:hypothetical protein